jgi:hypothetical protein
MCRCLRQPPGKICLCLACGNVSATRALQQGVGLTMALGCGVPAFLTGQRRELLDQANQRSMPLVEGGQCYPGAAVWLPCPSPTVPGLTASGRSAVTVHGQRQD